MPFIPAIAVLLQTSAPTPANVTSQVVSLRDTYTKTEVMVPMRDGKRLYTAIYAPKDASKRYPFLMQRTPYSCAPYGPDRFPGRPGPTAEFTTKGYIFVMQDVRGRYMSEDDHVFSPPHKPNKKGTDHDESSDTYDTVEWLLKNVPNNNGKVGVWGISQPGFYASNALLANHPAIVAVSPQAPVTDRFRGDDDHRNGAFSLAQRFNFLNSFGAPRPVPVERFDPTFRVSIQDAYSFFLDMGPLSNARKYFGDQKFWNQVMAHGTYDDFWKSRGMEQHLRKVKKGPAVLVVGGWFDAENLYGAVKTYNALAQSPAGSKTHFVMGPWWHGQWAGDSGERLGPVSFGSKTSDYFRDIVLPFFEHHLKGAPDPKIPRASVFETGSNQWRTYAQWPPKPVRPTTLRLGYSEDFGLGWVARSARDTYVSDPAAPVPHTAQKTGSVVRTFMIEDQAFASKRRDVLTFRTEPLANDVTLAGPVKVDLNVIVDSTDVDFVVKLVDIYPSDHVENPRYELPVRWDMMRGKFRESLERPKPIVPGKATKVNFTMNDVMHTFKKGHRISVQVQSSLFPLIDRNPQTFTDIYEAKASDFRPATIRLNLDPRSGSRLVLPVVSR